MLYLKTRNILRCSTTFSAIAGICLGEASGIVLNSLIVFAIFGIMALYMILFSQLSISLLGREGESFLNGKAFYVIFLCVLMAPIVVRKKISELKISTYILFAGVISLISLLTGLLIINGSYESRLAAGEIIAPV